MHESARADHGRAEESLLSSKDVGSRVCDAVVRGDYDQFAYLVDDCWWLQQRVSDQNSISEVGGLCEYPKCEYGALCGTVVGRGRGGFLMLDCPTNPWALAQLKAEQGRIRLYDNLGLGGSNGITNVFNAQSFAIHQQGVECVPLTAAKSAPGS